MPARQEAWQAEKHQADQIEVEKRIEDKRPHENHRYRLACCGRLCSAASDPVIIEATGVARHNVATMLKIQAFFCLIDGRGPVAGASPRLPERKDTI